ncbi:hypothetical protein COU54_03165 [Candidatus Pacearchaeota archaeon CG10_big_fil_rev_8_21_14_0_10_31_24]|nr:MAG: hypothetical protein COU54_03165 [Candidatus Pacearchaeota archaeon CG10_big_fil_rev_8_21_14_0_10_31_24]
MRHFEVFSESNIGINIERVLEKTQERLPREFSLGRVNLMDLQLQETREKYNAFDIEHILSKINFPDSILFFSQPLYANIFAYRLKEVGSFYPSIYRALGYASENKKHILVSSVNLGSGEIGVERVSKVLTHEIGHIIYKFPDDCCSESGCIMSNYPENYEEVSREVLEFLDKKEGWCEFHESILFPERRLQI